MEKKKLIIGRADIADFPLLDLYKIPIKIDSGAYTSSIHCTNVFVINNELICEFLDKNFPQYFGKKIGFKNFKTTIVKSSNGISSKRFSVKTKIHLFEKTYPITLTLNDREEMRFPVLIGRKFLSGKFLIDSQLVNVSHELKS